MVVIALRCCLRIVAGRTRCGILGRREIIVGRRRGSAFNIEIYIMKSFVIRTTAAMCEI